MLKIWKYCTETLAKRIISGSLITLIFGGGILGGVFRDAIQETAARHWNHYFNPENIQFDSGYYVGDITIQNGNKIAHGRGKITYTNGDWYDGEFGFGKKNGKGKYQYANGNWYDGQWLNDKPHGHGQFYFATYKRTDTGNYVNGIRSGKGVMQWDNGAKYEGTWQDNPENFNLNGNGSYYYANGTVEKGQWKNGKWEKEKIVESTIPVREDFENGYYIGTFKNGEWNGKGEYYLKSGSWYKGDFRNGKRHGKGQTYDVIHKRTDTGDYFEDKRKGKGEMIWESGRRYKGTWDDISKEVEWEGTMYYSNGESERGKWINEEWVKQ
jgi:hypothetical protein